MNSDALPKVSADVSKIPLKLFASYKNKMCQKNGAMT